MFGRKKESVDEAPSASSVVDEPSKKGRATPKRREAEARNKRPLVPTDRGAARRAQRQKMAEARRKMDQAMQTGEERYLPAQHRGQGRRFMRDYADARWSMAEAFMPMAVVLIIIMLAASFLKVPAVYVTGAFIGLYTIMFIALIDAILFAYRVRKRAQEKFGESVRKGAVMYVVLRVFQIRRTRLPKPQVARGDFPS